MQRTGAAWQDRPFYCIILRRNIVCPLQMDSPPGLKWLGLEVKAHTVQDADHATVSFVARSKLGGRAHRLQETSRFERRGGRWLYVDGDPT